MLRGIDISNWQKGLDLSKLNVDFAIIKATEGVNFVDAYCDNWVQWCIRNNRLWGFYHFARNNKPESEANFFHQNCKNYFGHGIPVLDIESESIANWGEYAQRFCDRIHALTGIYPMVYTSAGYLSRFEGTTVPDKCGLWVAGYPSKAWTDFTQRTMPYQIAPWKVCAIWQFSAYGKLPGYGGNLDLNFAYMDRSAWLKYANPNDEVLGDTTEIPKQPSKHHFEDDSMSVDVTLK